MPKTAIRKRAKAGAGPLEVPQRNLFPRAAGDFGGRFAEGPIGFGRTQKALGHGGGERLSRELFHRGRPLQIIFLGFQRLVPPRTIPYGANAPAMDMFRNPLPGRG